MAKIERETMRGRSGACHMQRHSRGPEGSILAESYGPGLGAQFTFTVPAMDLGDVGSNCGGLVFAEMVGWTVDQLIPQIIASPAITRTA